MLQRGSVVTAAAGKEKGRLLAVLAADADGLLLADGRKRRTERPKRKNPRHAAEAGVILDEAAMATNRELRRALAAAALSLEGG